MTFIRERYYYYYYGSSIDMREAKLNRRFFLYLTEREIYSHSYGSQQEIKCYVLNNLAVSTLPRAS